MLLLLSIAAFFIVLAIPALMSVREVMRPRDDLRLHIAEQYVRDPRWFGRAFRTMLAPFVAAARGGEAFAENVKLRTDEETRWSPDLAIAPRERVRGIAVGERVQVGEGAGIRDAYALESLDVEPHVIARTLTSDGVLHVGNDVTVLRWLDADGDVTVGTGVNLGVSASGGSRFTLGDRVRFERVWGLPVVSNAATAEPFALTNQKRFTRVDQAHVDAADALVLYGPVLIARDTQIASHVKVHGPLNVEPGVRIDGNLIVRGNLTFAADVSVSGHVFAEGDIRLGPGSRVGRSGRFKTVYADGTLVMAHGVEVEGWVVAENGGWTA
jgi:predicted acyltransferase (DUF342 family)